MGDVAKFYYNLLHSGSAHPLISDKSKAEMMNFKKLSRGWCAGYLEHGAGLMKLQYGYGNKRVTVVGHEGDTFGFLSSQGYVPSLKAAYSVVSNVDVSAPTEHMTTQLLLIASRILSDDVNVGPADDWSH